MPSTPEQLMLPSFEGLDLPTAPAARQWPIPEFSRSAVDRAGVTVTDASSTAEQREAAMSVVKNWRASHHFPLNSIQMHLRKAARKVDEGSIVAQRVKRMPSILRKLNAKDTGNMRLSQMQDIGGCRAVVSDPAAVHAVRSILLNSKMNHKVVAEFPYMNEPKATGYRSQHIVLQYQSRRFESYAKHLIEVQIRTRLQHAWSTAVEAVDIFLRLSLKAGDGPADWLEFFRLAANEFADFEGLPRAAGPGSDAARARLRELRKQLDVDAQLAAVGKALQVTEEQAPSSRNRNDFFLLYLRVDGGEPKLSVLELPKHDPRRATQAYDAVDIPPFKFSLRTPEAPQDVDVVLVSVDSLESLSAAYPNYFADTDLFFSALDSIS